MSRWPTDLDPIKCEIAQSKLRYLATAVLTAAVVLTIASGLVAYSVPYNHDLYNLVYANSRPIRGEDTYQFLLVFPGLLWLQGLLLWIDPTRQLLRRCQDDAMTAFIIGLNASGGLLFCLVAIMRIVTVWRWYFLSPMSALHP